jgi:formyl-CoA transferase
MILGDLGADVVKVESPGGDETRRWGPPFLGDTAAYYCAANRNKRSVALDLKSPAGRRDLATLLAGADVLVQNFTGDLARRLGVDADAVQAVNPRCIHVTISGFGPEQPDRRGYDLLAQALGGLMSVTGERGGHGLKVGVPIADLTAGTYAATAVTAALYDRERTGRVARIEVSLLDSVTSLLSNQAMSWLLCGVVPEALGNDHPTVVPYGVFPTATGDVVIAVAADAQFAALCQALGLGELAGDPRFATNADRVGHREELSGLLGSRLAGAPADHWVGLLTEAGIPCGSVRGVPEALGAPEARNLATVEHPLRGAIRQVLGPIRIDGEYLAPYLPPPALDEHHGELLATGDAVGG